jgi:scyllo-inositol 2-dehydrogenase (NADP+)
MIKVGLVGYGFAGRSFHAYLMGRVADLNLVAVATRSDARRAQAAAEKGVATYATLGELLAQSDVDMIVVATPHDTHSDLVCEALGAGKHVVTDKVMCLTVAEGERMIAAARQSGRVFSVFHNRRWDWDYLTVKQAIQSGLLGAPYLIEASVLRYRGPRGWRSSLEAGGGILYDWGAHLVDQALQLVREPVTRVDCSIQYRSWGAEIGSFARVQLGFESGLLYAIELGNLARIEKPRWYVAGDKGALVKYGLDPQEAAMLRGDIGAAKEAPELRARVTTEVNGLANEMVIESLSSDWTNYYRNVADAILGRAELAVKPEEPLRGVAILNSAAESARSGVTQVVRI